MATEGHEPLADELDAEADRLAEHGRDVQHRIEQTRDEWEQRRADDAVPGANPPAEQTPPGEDTAGS